MTKFCCWSIGSRYKEECLQLGRGHFLSIKRDIVKSLAELVLEGFLYSHNQNKDSVIQTNNKVLKPAQSLLLRFKANALVIAAWILYQFSTAA